MVGTNDKPHAGEIPGVIPSKIFGEIPGEIFGRVGNGDTRLGYKVHSNCTMRTSVPFAATMIRHFAMCFPLEKINMPTTTAQMGNSWFLQAHSLYHREIVAHDGHPAQDTVIAC